MSNQSIREIVHAWVHVLPHNISTGLEADGASGTARGNFLGDDTSDPKSTGQAIYTETQNLPTAVASILNHTQTRANFHPADTSPEKLAAAFTGYINEIDSNPFFHLMKSESTKQTFYSKDYNLLIDQIANLYSNLRSEDVDKIKTSITDMAKSVFGQRESEQWKNIFSQSTLDLTDLQNPRLYVYYTSLHMFHSQNGKSEVQEQDYEVRMTTYLVLPDLIRAHASTLAGLDKKSVDSWMNDSTSPERPNVKLCFRP